MDPGLNALFKSVASTRQSLNERAHVCRTLNFYSSTLYRQTEAYFVLIIMQQTLHILSFSGIVIIFQ